MNIKPVFLTILSCSFLCMACNTSTSQRITVDMMLPVATFSVVHGDSILTCDLTELQDTLYGSFTDICRRAGLTEPMEYVILEDTPEGMVSEHSQIAISDNYILICGKDQIPHKIFNRQGKLLGSIDPFKDYRGDIPYIQQAEIDEKNKRIFFMIGITPYLYSSAFDGSDFQKHCFLSSYSRPSNFILNTDRSTITLTSNNVNTPNSYMIWEQDWKGNVLDSLPYRNTYIPALQKHLSEKAGENLHPRIYYTHNTEAVDIYLNWGQDYSKGDTLYHYSKKEHRLIPRYTQHWRNKKEYFGRELIELPRHYAGEYWIYEKTSDIKEEHVRKTSYNQVGYPTMYLIEKATGKAAVLNIWNGFFDTHLGKKTHNGYFVNMGNTQLGISNIDYDLKGETYPDRREKLLRIREKLATSKNLYVRYAKIKP